MNLKEADLNSIQYIDYWGRAVMKTKNPVLCIFKMGIINCVRVEISR